jgi:hypothetical protein
MAEEAQTERYIVPFLLTSGGYNTPQWQIRHHIKTLSQCNLDPLITTRCLDHLYDFL